MFRQLNLRLTNYLTQIRNMDLIDFNKFIFRHLILHLFKTENILPFIIAICVIGFSLVVQVSRFIFIPQTSVAAYASFFIFTLVVSIITLVLYPIIIILIVNFFTSYIKDNSTFKFALKLIALLASFTFGAIRFAGQSVTPLEKLQIIFIWIGLYYVIVNLYLTHKQHNTILKLTTVKILFIIMVSILMTRPLVVVFLHTNEALNFTTINPQVYLSAPNCALLRNLDGTEKVSDKNIIFNNLTYYRDLPNSQGCYIYGNTIRYSFAYDYVLLIKKNIIPITRENGVQYNEYVRLNCFAGNCYSENHLFFKVKQDLYDDLIQRYSKIEDPL